MRNRIVDGSGTIRRWPSRSADAATWAGPVRSLIGLLSVVGGLTAAVWCPPAHASDFKRDVIYQIMIDRFCDGDPANNDPSQSRGLYDPSKSNWAAYWGGDLEGIRQKMSYLADLGITAIWISPPVDNVNASEDEARAVAPYHGYHARDFKRIEEHFGDATNSWRAFDALVAEAHRRGIKIIVDFAPNHSNNITGGEFGAFYDDGTLVGKYTDDPEGYFHHEERIANFKDAREVQYGRLSRLADFDQTNARVDRYLKESLTRFLDHGVDGFRIDAIKHVTWQWNDTLANVATTHGTTSTGSPFLCGEWIEETTNTPLYPALTRLANRSGIAALDFPLYTAINAVFVKGEGFDAIDAVLQREARDFARPNDLVTFIDNHDRRRFLSRKNDPQRLHEALAFLLTSRGVPVIYYGTEQYLHNDTEGGIDPYDRPMMTRWDTTAPAFRLVRALAKLRQENPALGCGTYRPLFVGHDAFVYRREFGGAVVVVAINRSDAASQTVSFDTGEMPRGPYRDYLRGEFGGVALEAKDTTAVELPPHSISVWTVNDAGASGPEIASVSPAVGQPGVRVSIPGIRFGSNPQVKFGAKDGRVVRVLPSEIVVEVPQVPAGECSVTVIDAQGRSSHAQSFMVLAAPLIPIVVTAENLPEGSGTNLYLHSETISTAEVGPFCATNAKSAFLCIAGPAGRTARFSLLLRDANGVIVNREPADAHSVAIPTCGVGRIAVEWQERR